MTRYGRYASLKIKRTDPEYQRKAFGADVKLLAQKKLMSAGEAKRALRWAETASPGELQAARDDFTRHEFMGQVLSDYRADLKDRGHDPADAFPPP